MQIFESVKGMKRKVVKRLRSINLFRNVRSNRSLSMLSPLITGWSYLPITDWAPGPEFYVHICNDIIINQKRSIVEFGSGITTILMARLLAKNNLDAKIISIDHDEKWQDIISHCCKMDNIGKYIQFICSPIAQEGKYSWYTASKIQFPADFVADTVVVDGPIGGQTMARYGAIPFIKKYLSKEYYTIYLHDTDRPDEQKILRAWHEMLPGSRMISRWRYSLLLFGTRFDFDPQSVT